MAPFGWGRGLPLETCPFKPVTVYRIEFWYAGALPPWDGASKTV